MDKQEFRERIWDELEESGEARFPFPPHGRIPKLRRRERRRQRLAEAPEWEEAETIRANPDAPSSRSGGGRFARERPSIWLSHA